VTVVCLRSTLTYLFTSTAHNTFRICFRFNVNAFHCRSFSSPSSVVFVVVLCDDGKWLAVAVRDIRTATGLQSTRTQGQLVPTVKSYPSHVVFKVNSYLSTKETQRNVVIYVKWPMLTKNAIYSVTETVKYRQTEK